jgi:hypothetical protein
MRTPVGSKEAVKRGRRAEQAVAIASDGYFIMVGLPLPDFSDFSLLRRIFREVFH